MMAVSAIREWLDTMQPTDMVAVDDGGLALVALKSEGTLCEIGGIPHCEECQENIDYVDDMVVDNERRFCSEECRDVFAAS